MNFKKIRWDWATAAALMMASIAWAFQMERNTARTAAGVEYFKAAFKEVAETQARFQDALKEVRTTGTENRARLNGVDRRLDDHQRQIEQFRGGKP